MTDPDHDTTRGEDAALLDYLRDRDVSCPACRHNLRAVTRPVCPECRLPLSLQLGAAATRHDPGWFVALLGPSIFSGIAALFLGIPMTIALTTGSGPIPAGIFATEAFGVLSGVTGVVLFAYRYRVLRWCRRTIVRVVAALWTVHLAATVALLIWAVS